MHRLAIGQKDNSQEAIVHLSHLRPTANSPVGLYEFVNRRGNGSFNPFIFESPSIGPASDGRKVGGNLH